jgi:hypothetical protein
MSRRAITNTDGDALAAVLLILIRAADVLIGCRDGRVGEQVGHRAVVEREDRRHVVEGPSLGGQIVDRGAIAAVDVPELHERVARDVAEGDLVETRVELHEALLGHRDVQRAEDEVAGLLVAEALLGDAVVHPDVVDAEAVVLAVQLDGAVRVQDALRGRQLRVREDFDGAIGVHAPCFALTVDDQVAAQLARVRDLAVHRLEDVLGGERGRVGDVP